MTDKTNRELLELAAKAAGLDVNEQRPGRLFLPHPTDKAFLGREWNALTDDGDALRLAASLGLVVSTDSRSVYAQTIPGITPAAYASQGGPDQMENIRRAIVRAAAEIGDTVQVPAELLP